MVTTPRVVDATTPMAQKVNPVALRLASGTRSQDATWWTSRGWAQATALDLGVARHWREWAQQVGWSQPRMVVHHHHRGSDVVAVAARPRARVAWSHRTRVPHGRRAPRTTPGSLVVPPRDLVQPRAPHWPPAAVPPLPQGGQMLDPQVLVALHQVPRHPPGGVPANVSQRLERLARTTPPLPPRAGPHVHDGARGTTSPAGAGLRGGLGVRPTTGLTPVHVVRHHRLGLATAVGAPQTTAPWTQHLTQHASRIVDSPMEAVVTRTQQVWQGAGLLADEVVHLLQRRVSQRVITRILTQSWQRQPQVVGLRLVMSGRVPTRSRKAQRARCQVVQLGTTPLHHLARRIDYAQRTARTRLGTTGIQVWLDLGVVTPAWRGAPARSTWPNALVGRVVMPPVHPDHGREGARRPQNTPRGAPLRGPRPTPSRGTRPAPLRGPRLTPSRGRTLQ